MIVFAFSFSFFLQILFAQENLLPEVDSELEPFSSISNQDLVKDAQPVTTLSEQCKRFLGHYRYYCRKSNIAIYNEEVRIICERYRAYCSDRVYPSINHIRRQVVMWERAGIPKKYVNNLKRCFKGCRQTESACVNACECIHMQWIFDPECSPGIKAPAAPNCQRWYQKCRGVWAPLPDYTPAKYSEMAPPPLVRGIFYGYEPLETRKTFDHPRDHGVSFWRGTQTTLVDWPEGKFAYANTYEVPSAGVNVAVPQVNIGFPSLQQTLRQYTKGNPDPLNPGTGRRY
ncbi:unnamed protein product, partial [Mesorhabditis belari]|uniref:Uncharacterized protein n=1 Tax=Mesorhabditis belari TaxID=2138241 RepID=A0AAF3FFR2_9BILA